MADQRYKIYEKLGAGGVGAVFRAYDSQLKRWVAIKRLLSARDASSAAGDELRREADALASMRNPNVVTVFDVATDDEGLFMVMELLEGEDLAHVVQRGPLHYDDFKELASQTLEALLAAHQRHILHRDIKPENIKVERLPGGRMQSKLIDFGLARAGLRARKQTEDQEGTVMGSIFYMAPEQLTREPVDERTDLYSLGCVFYEALSGRKAFGGDSMAAVIDQHINHDFTPLHVVAPHVPPWLNMWVGRLMARHPYDRPANAQQAIEEFRAWEKMPMMVPYGQWPMYAPQAMASGYAPAPAPGIQPASDVVPVHVAPAVVAPAGPAVQAVPANGPAVAPAPPVVRPVTASVHRAPTVRLPAAPPSAGAKRSELSPGLSSKVFVIIGAAIVVVLAGAWLVLRGNGDKTATSGGSASPSILGPSGPGKVTLTLPGDRAFPPVSDDICLHLVAGTGMFTSRKDANGKSAGAGDHDPVIEWHDLSPRGNNNLMRAFQSSAGHAPKRVIWPAQPNVVGPKTNRPVLQFRAADGKPAALNLTDVAGESEAFPFGGAAIKGERGLTLGLVFQADAAKLPTRLLTLSADAGTSASLRVDAQKKLVLEVRNGSGTASITSKDVDPTQPCVAVFTWQAGTGAVELRARDVAGKTFKSTGGPKVPAPAKPLVRLQLGQVQDANGKAVAASDQFAGYLADVILYSSVLKNDQIQLLESKALRDHYFQAPPTAPKK